MGGRASERPDPNNRLYGHCENLGRQLVAAEEIIHQVRSRAVHWGDDKYVTLIDFLKGNPKVNPDGQ